MFTTTAAIFQFFDLAFEFIEAH